MRREAEGNVKIDCRRVRWWKMKGFRIGPSGKSVLSVRTIDIQSSENQIKQTGNMRRAKYFWRPEEHGKFGDCGAKVSGPR